MSSFVHPQPPVFPPQQPDDLNSPALFKDNITLVQSQISTVRSLAREALNAMCVRSHPLHALVPRALVISARVSTSPDRAPLMQLVRSISRSYSNRYLLTIPAENLDALRQSLQTLNELLYTTGVGSLPLLPPETTEPPTEEQLADQANKAITTLFTLHTRTQETAAVAANIMAAPDPVPRR